MLGAVATTAVTTLLTSVFVAVLIRRWLLGYAKQRTVPHLFCSWLTSTAAFAQYGCDYLAWATSIYNGGDFSVTLMFRMYTFLGTPESVKTFTRAPTAVLALQPAVEQFTEKNFGLPAMLWEEGVAKPTGTLHRILSSSMLSRLQQQLCITQLQTHEQYFPATSTESKLSPILGLLLADLVWWPCDRGGRGGGVDIASVIPSWTMHASLIALFGTQFMDMIDAGGLDAFLAQFEQFDRLFEAASSPLPGFLFPQFHSARAFLLRELHQGVQKGVFTGTIADSVLQSCGLPAKLHANVLLALLWAGLTNVSMTAFWAVSFLLLPCHQHWRAAVERQTAAACAQIRRPSSLCRDQEQEAAAGAGAAEGAAVAGALADAVLAAALGEGEKSLLMGCVHEALRLRAQGIILRRAVAPLHVPAAVQPETLACGGSGASGGHRGAAKQAAIVPPGSLVAISPYQLHHDPRFFSEPHVFDPSRHGAADAACRAGRGAGCGATAEPCVSGEDKAAAEKPPQQEAAGLRVAFGAGTFRCPGRSLALAQASLSVAVFFACTEATLCGADDATCNGMHGMHAARTSMRSSREKEHFAQAAFGSSVPKWLQAVPGAHIVARGVRSGDPHAQLPRFDARQLVGVKKPIDPLYAVVRSKVHALAA